MILLCYLYIHEFICFLINFTGIGFNREYSCSFGMLCLANIFSLSLVGIQCIFLQPQSPHRHKAVNTEELVIRCMPLFACFVFTWPISKSITFTLGYAESCQEETIIFCACNQHQNRYANSYFPFCAESLRLPQYFSGN